MRRPGNELLDEVSERALLKLGGGMASCLRSLSDAIEDGVAGGDFHVKDATLLANTLYASGLGALMLARSGLVIRESAPGIPVVGEISPEQVKQHMVAAGDFSVGDATLLANTLYASGLGALMLARSGLVIRESAPGVPVVGEISADQVKQHMVASALAAARGQPG